MQPLNSSLHTEYSTGTRNNKSGYYVFAGDFRLCRYDPLRARLYFRGRIMSDLEYEVKVDDFIRAIQNPPAGVSGNAEYVNSPGKTPEWVERALKPEWVEQALKTAY